MINRAHRSRFRLLVRFRSGGAANNKKKFDLSSVRELVKDDVKKPVIKGEYDGREETLEILKSAKARSVKFIDLENKGLDLSLLNKKLVSIISNNLISRMDKRINKISHNWRKTLKDLVSKIPQDKLMYNTGDKVKDFTKEFQHHLTNPEVSVDVIGRPVSVGDLVVIREGSTEFFMVAAIPEDLDSESYTFINSKGRIVFGPKFTIKLRIPTFLPKYFLPIIKSMVVLEEKTLNMAPIGVVDSHLSRSIKSKPRQLQNSTSEDTTSLMDEVEEDDFIASKATAQYLINSDINTYVVPESARLLYTKLLTKLSIDSLDTFKDISFPLQILHRALQFEENGNIYGSPRIVSIFQIMYFLKKFKLGPILSSENILDSYKKISKEFNEDSSNSDLGESMNGHFEKSKYNLSLYFAVVLLLRKQNRSWKIIEQNLTNPAISIIVLPIDSSYKKKELVSNLKGKTKVVSGYIIKKIIGPCPKKEPESYKQVLQLFKDFIIGNLRNDYELESLCTTLIREVDTALDLSSPYTYEYGKSKCYDILKLLGELNGTFENPANWALGLEQTSFKTKLADEYYSILQQNKQLLQTDTFQIDDLYETDPVEKQREEFEEPIFCIDSETAHEIDDGIALKKEGDKYIVTVHIANPSSYINPKSSLSKIALSKSFTTYLPEGPIKMLPDFVSDLSGLGTHTRTFGIEFEVPVDFEQIDPKDLQRQVYNSGRIKFYKASNFPQGYTYKHVDKILNGNTDDRYATTLKTIHAISRKLKQVRLEVGGAITFNNLNQELQVKFYNKTEDDTKKFIVDDYGCRLKIDGIEIYMSNPQGDSKSVELVTEMMIMANHLTSVIAHNRKVPLIYRNQVVGLSSEIKQQIMQLNASDDYNERLKIIRVMNSAHADVTNRGHESLGLSGYAHITSPLRRYSDMINQWMFQKQINSAMEDIDLRSIVLHLQSKEIINKELNKFSTRFWKGIFLREYFRLAAGMEKELKLKYVIDRPTSADRIRIHLENFNSYRSFLEIDEMSVGDIQTGMAEIVNAERLELKKIDFIENELVISYA